MMGVRVQMIVGKDAIVIKRDNLYKGGNKMAVLDSNKAIHRYFEEIASIPHGSFHEEKIADYIESFAKRLQLTYIRDEMHNMIIYKPASKGYEEHPAVMLQGHMDMVNEKNHDSNHDFDNDPLDLYIEDGYLKARGTTLGADDGCGVVYMLAILADTSLKHPDLECVFTVQEEVGLHGAMNIQAKDIHARRMIGLDSGHESEVCTSSSGGRRVVISRYVALESNSKPTYKLVVDGLLGGHSGGEIDKERGNANKIAVRTLFHLLKHDIDVNIISIFGGLKENAIARECQIIFNSASSLESIQEVVAKVNQDVRFELEFSDGNVEIDVEPYQKTVNALSSKVSKEIIEMLYVVPDGFRNKSMVIEGLTTVSLNMGVVRLEDNYVKAYFSIRSPMESAREELSNQLSCIATAYHCEYDVNNDYPGWQYDAHSNLRKQWLDFVFQREGVTLQSEASHGGLETGIFKGILPDLDIVTMGPNMQYIHTPDEQLELASFEKCYDRLVGFLEIL